MGVSLDCHLNSNMWSCVGGIVPDTKYSTRGRSKKNYTKCKKIVLLESINYWGVSLVSIVSIIAVKKTGIWIQP